MAKPFAVICDLDGTLCDIGHRFPLLNIDFEKFSNLMLDDTPNEMVFKLLQFLRFRDFKIIFVSARAEAYRTATKFWLAKHCPGFENFPLFLRGVNDCRFDEEIKREIVTNLIVPDYDVKLVIEDRDNVVNMYRSLGLQCWQVANGNY